MKCSFINKKVFYWFIGIIVVFIATLYLLYFILAGALNSIAIDKIRLNNDLKFTTIKEARLAIVMSDNLNKGFFSFDTEKMVNQLQKFNWIQNVSVSKTFPDVVTIRIIERVPYAMWTNGQQVGYITKDGNLFYSKNQLNLNNQLRELATKQNKLNNEDAKSQAVENAVKKLNDIEQNAPKEIEEQQLFDDNTEQTIDLDTLTKLNSELLQNKQSITDVDKLSNKIPVLISNKYYIRLALKYWFDIQDILANSNLSVKEVRIDSSDSWNIMLNNGIVLNLDAVDYRKALARFLRASNSIKVPEGYFISYVDLRYDNGVAIKFVNKDEAKNNPNLIIHSLVPGQGGRVLSNAQFAPKPVKVDYQEDIN